MFERMLVHHARGLSNRIDVVYTYHCEIPSSLSLLIDSDLLTGEPDSPALAGGLELPPFPHPLTRICRLQELAEIKDIHDVADEP